ncbi:MAG: VOC family protein [Pseudomonadota bacterium]
MSEFPLLSHVSVGTNDMARATAFYDAVMATLGCHQILNLGTAAAYGREFPVFWVNVPLDETKPANPGNGIHIAFTAKDQDQVKAFWQAGIDAGAEEDGAPGPRPEYGAPYYGCFLRDPDGNKIEAVFWDKALAEKQ